MNMKSKHLVRRAFFATLVAPAVLAADSDDISHLDFDKDGRISRVELMAGVEFWADPMGKRTLLRDLAAKPPATLEAAGVSADTKEIHYPYFLKMHRLTDRAFHTKESIQGEWFPFGRAELRPKRKVDASLKWKRMADSPLLKIRRDLDDLGASSAGDDPKDKKVDARKGALFSFSHDFAAGADQWLARGLISLGGDWELNRAWRQANQEESLLWNTIGFHGNVLFDRVDGPGGKEAESDILEFSLMAHGLTMPGPVGAFLISGSVVDSTDFEFDRQLLGGSLELEWVNPNAGLHGYIETPIGVLTGRFKMRVEGGTPVSGSNDPATHTDDTFFRVGPTAELNFFPGLVEDRRLKLYAKGSYLADVEGGEDSKLFIAGASYSLPVQLIEGAYEGSNVAGKLSLNIEYRNGELPFNAQRDESLVIGLGILF